MCRGPTPEPLNATPALPLGGAAPLSSSPPTVNPPVIPGYVPLNTTTPGPVTGGRLDEVRFLKSY